MISAFGVEHDQISKKVLTQSARDKIKTKNFAMPGSRSYPIQDRKHARNALSRAAQSKTKGNYSEIARKVHEKYPDIGISKFAVKRPRGRVKRGKIKLINSTHKVVNYGAGPTPLTTALRSVTPIRALVGH